MSECLFKGELAMPYFPEIKTIGDISRYHAKAHGSHCAFICFGRSVTSADLAIYTTAVANALLA